LTLLLFNFNFEIKKVEGGGTICLWQMVGGQGKKKKRKAFSKIVKI